MLVSVSPHSTAYKWKGQLGHLLALLGKLRKQTGGEPPQVNRYLSEVIDFILGSHYGRLVERLTRLPFKEEIAGSNPVPVTRIAGSLFGDYGR